MGNIEEQVDIVVVSALKEELEFLFKKQEFNWSNLVNLNNKLSCKIGELSSSNSSQVIKIAAAYAEGMGLVDAAILTTTAI